MRHSNAADAMLAANIALETCDIADLSQGVHKGSTAINMVLFSMGSSEKGVMCCEEISVIDAGFTGMRAVRR